MATLDTLVGKLATLPTERLAEVEDFVEFLVQKDRRQAALDRLLAVAPALHAAGVEPMGEEEINAEIEASRAERRLRRTPGLPGADRP